MSMPIRNIPRIQPLGKIYYDERSKSYYRTSGLPDPEQIKEEGRKTMALGTNRVSAADIKNENEIKWRFYDFINRCVQFLSRIPLLNRLPGISTVHGLLKKGELYKTCYSSDFETMQQRTCLLGSDQDKSKEEIDAEIKDIRSMVGIDDPDSNAYYPAIEVLILDNTDRSDSITTSTLYVSKKMSEPLNELRVELDLQDDTKIPQIIENKIATFNYGNAVHSGGAAMRGMRGSQEEALFFSTFLYQSLDPVYNAELKYQIEESQLAAHRHVPYFGGVFSPHVPRSDLFNPDYDMYECHNFITMAACDLRPKHDGIGFLGRHNNPENLIYRKDGKPTGEIDWEKVELRTKAALRNSLIGMFKANIEQVIDDLKKDPYFERAPKHIQHYKINAKRIDTINLAAIGCGVFGNDPKRMAKWIVDVLQEPEFAGLIRTWLIPQANLDIDKKQFFDENDELIDFEILQKQGKLEGQNLQQYIRLAFEEAVKNHHP